jgi:hypothetical protein
MRNINLSITSDEGEVWFETSLNQIKNEIQEDFPEEEIEVGIADLITAIEVELDSKFYQS